MIRHAVERLGNLASDPANAPAARRGAVRGKRPIGIRHPIAVLVSFFLEAKPVSGRHGGAKSRV